jgi:glutathione synthase/RimK-type ligase-like ATP-grasp enzyme
MLYIYSWKAASEGSKALAVALNARRIKHENSTFKGGPKKIVINWGSSSVPSEVEKSSVLNKPQAVGVCANKLNFFNKVSGHCSVPDWTTDTQVAMSWVAEGSLVCARTVLSGHSAEGLVIMSKDNLSSFTKAPLYTRYIPKQDEYRVHVVRGEIIDVQRKALRTNYIEENDGKKPNFHIRNLANGFVYVRGDVNPPESVFTEAKNAITAAGLDFGAVDLIFNNKRNTAYVLEINSAPGIEGTTVTNYANAFKLATTRKV